MKVSISLVFTSPFFESFFRIWSFDGDKAPGTGLDSAAAEAAKKDRLFDEVLVPELRRGKDCDQGGGNGFITPPTPFLD